MTRTPARSEVLLHKHPHRAQLDHVIRGVLTGLNVRDRTRWHFSPSHAEPPGDCWEVELDDRGRQVLVNVHDQEVIISDAWRPSIRIALDLRRPDSLESLRFYVLQLTSGSLAWSDLECLPPAH